MRNIKGFEEFTAPVNEAADGLKLTESPKGQFTWATDDRAEAHAMRKSLNDTGIECTVLPSAHRDSTSYYVQVKPGAIASYITENFVNESVDPVNEAEIDIKLKDSARELENLITKCYGAARDLSTRLKNVNMPDGYDDLVATKELLDQAMDRMHACRDAMYKK